MDAGPAASRKGPAPLRLRERTRFEWSFALLALPALVIYLGFLIGPVVAGFYFSFTRWDGINPPKWIGLDNFVKMAGDRKYAAALVHTLIFTVVIVAGQVGVGLGLALLLNRARRGVAFMRGVFFAPALMSTAVIALIWGFMYSPAVGLVGKFAEAAGLGDTFLRDVLGNQQSALLGVSIVVIWQFAGYMMIIFLAGLKNIPQEVYEAAAIDGAAGARQFRSITWPLLAPSVSIAVLISLAGNLKLFDQVYLMTGGGPAGATETVGTLIYQTAFLNSNYGYSVAQSVVLTVIIVLVVLAQRWLTSRRMQE
ncbi:carbohydrate ABC transporter permease [Pseudarthrobacter sp. W1I19]|uniref:carbohydrate ABC transporter permease n=1 Tax=Pseudarthrobacter sp. W1I19 TaxID=3042288 RepID=UPI0027D8FD71|nr:sugar ABC transporter permease [Pseudarthrobacter sp. W1I19]